MFRFRKNPWLDFPLGELTRSSWFLLPDGTAAQYQSFANSGMGALGNATHESQAWTWMEENENHSVGNSQRIAKKLGAQKVDGDAVEFFSPPTQAQLSTLQDYEQYYVKKPLHWFTYYGPPVSGGISPGLAGFKRFVRENQGSYTKNPDPVETMKPYMDSLLHAARRVARERKGSAGREKAYQDLAYTLSLAAKDPTLSTFEKRYLMEFVTSGRAMKNPGMLKPPGPGICSVCKQWTDKRYGVNKLCFKCLYAPLKNPSADEYSTRIRSTLRKKAAIPESAQILGQIVKEARLAGELDGVEEQRLLALVDSETEFHNNRFHEGNGDPWGALGVTTTTQSNPQSGEIASYRLMAALLALGLVAWIGRKSRLQGCG